MLFACFLPAFAETESAGFGAYKHVFIIGVDGAGGNFSRTDTPEFDRIFASGAVILSLFLAAAPYEVVVLLINTVIYNSQRPTHSITLSAFVQIALVLVSLIIVFVSLIRKDKKEK